MNCPICRVPCISQLALARHVFHEHPPVADGPCDVRTSGWEDEHVVFDLVSHTARKWTDDYLEVEPHQWCGRTKLFIERAAAEDFSRAMREAGLEVR